MLSDVGDRAGEFRLSSVYERVRFFDECMAREEASMGDMLTVKETATAVPRPVQATGSRPDRPRDRQQEPFDEAIQGELLPPQRPVSPKTARVRTQPIPQAPPNTKKRRVNLTGLRQPKFKRARLAKSSVEKQNDDGGKAAPIP